MAALDTVQYVVANSWSSGTTITFTVTAPTNGNSGVIMFTGSTTLVWIASISVTGGASWTLAKESAKSSHVAQIWTASGFTGATTTITVTLNTAPGGAGALDASFEEVEGLFTVDANTATAVATSTTPTITLTPATSGRKARMYQSMRTGANYSSGPNGGFTELTSADGRVRMLTAAKTIALTAGTAETCDWVTVSGAWEGVMATILAPGTYSVGMVTQPQCSRSGQANSVNVAVEILNLGVRDTGFVGTVAATKGSGSGTIGGTTSVTVSDGVATFTNLQMAGAGVHTFTFTKSSGSEAVTSAAFNLREVPYTTTANWSTVSDIVDSVCGNNTWYKMFVPSGATSGVALPCIAFGHPSGFGGQSAAAVDNIAANCEFGQLADQHKGTFPWFMFVPSTGPANAGAGSEYRSFEAAIVEGILRARADGFNIDLSRIYFYGFSTGAIRLFDLAYLYPYFFAAMISSDASLTGDHLCNRNVLGGYFNPQANAIIDQSFWDPNGRLEVTGDFIPMAELARVMALGNTSLLMNRGFYTASVTSPTNRDIGELATPFIASFDPLISPDVSQTSSAGTTPNIPSNTTKRIYNKYPSLDHGPLDNAVCAAWDAYIKPWLDGSTQTRTQFGPISSSSGDGGGSTMMRMIARRRRRK